MASKPRCFSHTSGDFSEGRALPARPNPQAGFTLIEATVSLAILVIVLVVSLSLLFTMRSFAQKQEIVADARQTARRALDYVSYYVRGASDMNAGATNNALVMWPRTAGGLQQKASYNNFGLDPGDAVANASQDDTNPNRLADWGTDIITVASALNARAIPINQLPPGGLAGVGPIFFTFRDGCLASDTQNMYLFQSITGCTQPNCDGSSNVNTFTPRTVLTLVDDNGNWTYYQISKYDVSNCADPQNVVQIDNNPALNSIRPPPGGAAVALPANLMAGVRYFSFRVLTVNGIPQLQQKYSMVDPNGALLGGPADAGPNSTFVPLLDNVEDLQVAYIFNDGTIWNNTAAPLHQLATPGFIPQQTVPSMPGTRDISFVRGLRVTITARSSQPFAGYQLSKDKYPLLVAEDHDPMANAQRPPAGNPVYRTYRYQLSATLMLRSRMLGE